MIFGGRRLAILLQREVRGIVRLVSPFQCPACGGRTAGPPGLCPPCLQQADRETRRGIRVRLAIRQEARPAGGGRVRTVGGGRHRWLVVAAGRYRGAWARVVRAYKADPHPWVAEVAEERLVRAVFARRGHAPRFHRGRTNRCPVLVPVPMAPVRVRERGLNPAERLAAAVARRLGYGFAPRGLRRTTYRRPLRGLTAERRHREVAGAFAPTEETKRLEGRPVVLIDDVVTTGATLLEAASVLTASGTVVRGAWVLARTPRRRGARPNRPDRVGPAAQTEV